MEENRLKKLLLKTSQQAHELGQRASQAHVRNGVIWQIQSAYLQVMGVVDCYEHQLFAEDKF